MKVTYNPAKKRFTVELTEKEMGRLTSATFEFRSAFSSSKVYGKELKTASQFESSVEKARARAAERDEDGLFKTYCESCGAVVYNATSPQPHPNCDECPGHDDIARRDQEAADKD